MIKLRKKEKLDAKENLKIFGPAIVIAIVGFLWFKLCQRLSFFFFNLFIVVLMVRHIAQSKKVNFTIILNSINGYLLIGILGAVLLIMAELLQKFLYHLNTGAINFAGGIAQGFHDFLYFSFVTLTTLGYGDVTPVSAFAKSVTLIIVG